MSPIEVGSALGAAAAPGMKTLLRVNALKVAYGGIQASTKASWSA